MSQVHDGIDSHRNSIIVAHRRGGKTVGMVAQCIREAFLSDNQHPLVAYIAPTAKQARNVAWQYFVDMLRYVPGVEYRRHELEIMLPNGGKIIFASGDSYDRLRGLSLSMALVDEAADCPESMIDLVLRPALSDQKGKLVLIGTVKGRGPFWQQYLKAVDDNTWYAGKFLPEDTGVIDQEELLYLRREMGEEAYRQEMLCDPSAAIRGAYYGRDLADHEKQQTAVPYDSGLGVTVAMDLGMADSTAIWFAQLHGGGEIRLLEYLEYQNTSFVQILSEIRDKYHITQWIGPHDLRVREYTSGQSRQDAARELGIRFEIAPKMPVIDGIEAVRRAVPRMWFDEKRCREGLDRLALYRSDYDEKRRVLSRNPVHDYTSHAADAMRYLITGTAGGQRSLFETNMPEIDYSMVGGD